MDTQDTTTPAAGAAEEQAGESGGPSSVSTEEALAAETAPGIDAEAAWLRAIVEAVVYITDEPLTVKQIADALERPVADVQKALDELVAEYAKPEHGLTIREVAEGYKMGTKTEHHDTVRAFVRKLTPPLKLSMAALETLSVIAYKQPITAPEVLEIRGVQGAGVLKTLLDRKLITTAGRKNVIGRPILYKTTKEFLVQFGLKSLNELPTLKEFEELARMALADSEIEPAPSAAGPEAPRPAAAEAEEPNQDSERQATAGE